MLKMVCGVRVPYGYFCMGSRRGSDSGTFIGLWPGRKDKSFILILQLESSLHDPSMILFGFRL